MRKLLTDYEAEKFLKKYIPVSKNELVNTFEDITIKIPVALKIISDDVLHKSDINGVRIITHQEDVKKHFNDLLRIAKQKKVRLDGIMVQKLVLGPEAIIGIKKDPVFNHVLVFGAGGIFTEILDDVSIRKCPITLQDAQEMIDETKSKKIFYGFRGRKVNINLLKKAMVSVSKIPLKYKNIEELDINPFIFYGDKGHAADARIVFS